MSDKEQNVELCTVLIDSGVPRNFVRGRGGSKNSVEDRERGSGGGSPLPPSQEFWRQL